MSHSITLNKNTREIADCRLNFEKAPKTLEYYADSEKFVFSMPARWNLKQIYWNKNEPSFDEYFVLLEHGGYAWDYSRERALYSGKDILKLREILSVSTQAHGSIIGKLKFLGDEKKEYLLEKDVCNSQRSNLIYDGKKVPLDELLHYAYYVEELK